MPSIQKWHLPVLFYPDLVAGVLGEDWEGGDMKSELAGLGVLAYASVSRVLLARSRKYAPKQVPKESNLSLDIEVARFAIESRT